MQVMQRRRGVGGGRGAGDELTQTFDAAESAEVGAHGDHETFQGGPLADFFVDWIRIAAGYRGDHGGDGFGIERRHDNPMVS